MPQFGIAFAVGFILVYWLTPKWIALCTKRGWAFAQPDERKVHTEPKPQAGGVVFLFALWIVALIAKSHLIWQLTLTASVVCAAGLVDDIKEVRPGFRLAIQIFMALALALGGVRIDYISHPVQGVIHLGFLAIPLTVLWIVGVTNAMNFIDGLDGLAAGLSFIAAIAFFLLSFSFHDPQAEIWILSGTLSGVCLAFLRYNFFPARVFMGDSGAYLLGFLLAAISIIGPFKSLFFFVLLAPIMAMGLPLLDMITSVLRRLLHGKSPASPDKHHLHHRLLEKGFTPKQAVVFMYLISSLFVLVSLYLSQAI